MLRYLPSKQRGLTLIEASVSAAVVGIALLGILRLQMQLTKDNADSPVRTAALNAAQQKIEELRAKKYEEISTVGSPDEPLAGDNRLKNAVLSRSWAVSEVDNKYKSVTVTVDWTDSRGEQTVRLSSYIAKTDPTQAGAFLKGLSSSNP